MAQYSQLRYVLQGGARLAPTHMRLQRLPVTLDVLQKLYQVWFLSPDFNYTMLWAACCVGFFGFLHSGEFTVQSSHQPCCIAAYDVAVNSRSSPTHLKVTLQHSKIDPFRCGLTIYVGCSGTHIGPVSAVLAYLAVPQHQVHSSSIRTTAPFLELSQSQQYEQHQTGLG